MRVDRHEALQQAYQALMDGPAEPTSLEGAKVNALHSIAWSLMGLLAKEMEAEGEPAGERGLRDVIEHMALHEAAR